VTYKVCPPSTTSPRPSPDGVSTLVARPATGQDDLRLAADLLTQAWRSDPSSATWTPGDLAWWFAQAWPGGLGGRLRLWSLEGSVVAWSWHDPDEAEGPAEIEFHAWTGDLVLDAAVGRAIVEARVAAGGSVDVWAADDDAARIALLRDSGFALQEPGAPGSSGHLVSSQYQRDLEAPIPSDDLPAGYRIRSVVGPEDISRRVEVHRAAFAPSRMVEGKYQRLITLPPYRFEDDLVVEAPDGSFAAFTMAWWDPLARVGEFEPVGTHPDHQRRGLGKALLSHALRRYSDAGARLVQVFSSADNVASEALYQSVGFRRRALHRRYRLPG
jgi:ribosomal protein S18 acetylase RimI-like enzyme